MTMIIMSLTVTIYFKNIIYSYYIKEISKKLKTAQINKAKTGPPASSEPYIRYFKNR